MEEVLLCEKYRPHTVADTILPPELKKTFSEFVKKRVIPNLLLSGRSGIGKTTIAKAMLDELKADYIVINGSLEGRQIDVLRNEIKIYATSLSLTSGGRKYVVLDEADYLNPNTVQPALRNFMEEFSDNCGFILTCNYKGKIIEPLHSRCACIEFNISKKDKPALASAFFKRVVAMLKAEKIEYSTEVVAALIAKHFPDLRRVINELQRYSIGGKIDPGILADVQEASFKSLIPLLKDKNFTGIRKWVSDNSDVDPSEIYRALYEHCATHFTPQTIPILISLLAKYQGQDAFALVKEINTASCLLEIMVECSIK